MNTENCTKSDVTLKDYADTRFVAAKEYTDARIAAVNEATRIAHVSMDKRLEGMNEFRNSLKDQSAKFLNRDEYTLMHGKVLEDVRDLRESRAELAGKASQNAVIGAYVLGVIGLLLSAANIVGHFLK